jgi:UPF0755 protein
MVRRKISRKTPGYLKISLWVILAGIVVGLYFAFRLYRMVFLPATNISDAETTIFYIPTGSGYTWLRNSLHEKKIINDAKAFDWLAKKKNLANHVYPGRYRIKNGMTNNELINMLRSGKQEPVMLTFNNIRTLKELSTVVSGILEPETGELFDYLNNPSTPGYFGFTKETFLSMFIPNSYEFYWNTSPKEFAKRMKQEYIAFWSGARDEKATKSGFSREEIATLASIVEQESLHPGENARIAGVFINRLDRGIPLQSDPTIIYALQNFTMRRVLNVHKKIDSPYNTYIHRGLPPGPICIPSIEAIDAVLQHEKHDYLFFCAKPDFSGYHNFAKTLSQHNKNARSYQQALNRRKIYK